MSGSGDFGPKMAALPERMQLFVLGCCNKATATSRRRPRRRDIPVRAATIFAWQDAGSRMTSAYRLPSRKRLADSSTPYCRWRMKL
jgi:hypothetical protein